MKKERKPKLSREERKALRAEAKAKRKREKQRQKADRAEKSPTILTQHEQAQLEKSRAKRLKFVARAALAFLLYAAMMLVLFFGIFISIWTTKRWDNTVVTSHISVAEKAESKNLNVLTENSVSYISVSFLENYGEVIHAGDYAVRTIRFPASGDCATFAINSSFCAINDVSINLGHPVLLREGELYLPLDFFRIYVTGITVDRNIDQYEISANGELGYKIKPASTTTAIPEEAAGSLLEFAMQKPTFLSNLDAYERYMNPGETTEYLTLVNLQNGISETFRPNDLTGVEDQNAAYPGGDYHARLRLYAAKSLDAMIQEARANGYLGLQATSGYRSYAEQRYRFNTLVTSLMSSEGFSEAEAEAEAVKSVQKPGFSEYQTGLCADVRFPNEDIETFKDTEAAKWLADNCYKFGFILRYPESKTESTGMEAQSWHFRYVGRYHAVRIKFLDMSLEEYYAFMDLEQKPN